MVGLVIYIASFVIVIAIVASITTFFNNNVRNLSGSESIRSEYNKFNVYMLEYTKNDYQISRCSNNKTAEQQFVTFIKDGKSDTFVKLGNVLYFNQIKLCEKVDEFKVERTKAENGKELLKTYIKINGTVYTTDYVMAENNSELWKYSGVYSDGSFDGDHIYWGGQTKETLVSGLCNISPKQFSCDFRYGNHAATAISEATFTVQGYSNGTWETLFTKKATRPTYAATYTAFTGIEECNATKAYTNFRVLFNSSDNERYVYVELKIK